MFGFFGKLWGSDGDDNADSNNKDDNKDVTNPQEVVEKELVLQDKSEDGRVVIVQKEEVDDLEFYQEGVMLGRDERLKTLITRYANGPRLAGFCDPHKELVGKPTYSFYTRKSNIVIDVIKIHSNLCITVTFGNVHGFLPTFIISEQIRTYKFQGKEELQNRLNSLCYFSYLDYYENVAKNHVLKKIYGSTTQRGKVSVEYSD